MKKNILLIPALLGALSFSATAEAATVKCLVTYNLTTQKRYGGHYRVRVKIARAQRAAKASFKNKNPKTRVKIDIGYYRMKIEATRPRQHEVRNYIEKSFSYKALRRTRNNGKYDVVIVLEDYIKNRGRGEMTTYRAGWFNVVDDEYISNHFHNRLTVARALASLNQARSFDSSRTKGGLNTLMARPSSRQPAYFKKQFFSGPVARREGFRFDVNKGAGNNARRVENRHWAVSNYK